MKFEVLKPFTWAGQDLRSGGIVEIPDESTKIGSLTRAHFIRLAGSGPSVLPKVEEVAQEIEAEKQPVSSSPVVVATRDPKEIVRQAKAKAASKKK